MVLCTVPPSSWPLVGDSVPMGWFSFPTLAQAITTATSHQQSSFIHPTTPQTNSDSPICQMPKGKKGPMII